MKQWTHEVYAGKRSLGEVEVLGRRVFLRVDYNVPMDGERLVDDTKIARSLATIRYLVKRGASKIVIGTHLGRPEVVDDPVHAPADGGVRPLLACLNQHLEQLGDFPVRFGFAFIEAGPVSQRWFMVQNLRTLAVEKSGAAGDSRELFDRFLEANCDLMVNDGFGVLHRRDYSVVGVALDKVAGLLVDAEMQGLSLLLGKTRPLSDQSPTRAVDSREIDEFVRHARALGAFKLHAEKPIDLLLIGGCKLEDKIKLVKNLLQIGSGVFLGGLLGVPFSLKPYAPDVAAIVAEALQTGANVLLPKDYVLNDLSIIAADQVSPATAPRIRDIGPETEEQLRAALAQCRRVFWNGALGQAEVPEFAHGTNAVLDRLRERQQALASELGSEPSPAGEQRDSMLCAGGGDTAGYIHSQGYEDAFDFVFTGGGATLEALEGKVLPGVVALMDSQAE